MSIPRGTPSFTLEGLKARLDQMQRDIADLKRLGHWNFDEDDPAVDEVVGARIVRSSNQTIPDVTDTAISFDTASFDDRGWFDAGSPTLLTVDIAGRFLAQATCTYFPNATGSRKIQIQVSGVGVVAVTEVGPAGGGSHTALNVQAVVDLDAGDTVQAIVYQSTGGSLDLVDFPGTPSLAVVRLGSTP